MDPESKYSTGTECRLLIEVSSMIDVQFRTAKENFSYHINLDHCSKPHFPFLSKRRGNHEDIDYEGVKTHRTVVITLVIFTISAGSPQNRLANLYSFLNSNCEIQDGTYLFPSKSHGSRGGYPGHSSDNGESCVLIRRLFMPLESELPRRQVT